MLYGLLWRFLFYFFLFEWWTSYDEFVIKTTTLKRMFSLGWSEVKGWNSKQTSWSLINAKYSNETLMQTKQRSKMACWCYEHSWKKFNETTKKKWIFHVRTLATDSTAANEASRKKITSKERLKYNFRSLRLYAFVAIAASKLLWWFIISVLWTLPTCGSRFKSRADTFSTQSKYSNHWFSEGFFLMPAFILLTFENPIFGVVFCNPLS